MKDKFKSSMKKKLMLYVFSALVFILLITISIFYAMTSYEKSVVIKGEMKVYGTVISDYIESNNFKGLKDIINQYEALGFQAYFVSENKNLDLAAYLDGKNIEKEIPDENDVIEYTLNIQGGDGLKILKPLDNKLGIQQAFLFYYLMAILIILAISMWLANKLAYIIVKPISDLDFITSRIASGELSRRIKINSNDEIGQLGANFNHMANKLEKSLNEVSEKQNRLSAILESMESGVIAIDNNKNIITINNYAKKIFEVNKDVVGYSIDNLSSEVNFQQVFSRDSGDIQEIKLSYPCPKILRVRCGDIIINNHQHIGAVAVIQDITDVKKLENMRTEFVANVSHELKTPLTSIRGFAETLRDVDDEETKNKFIDIINEEAERLTRLISDILLLSHIEQNQEQKKEIFNADNVIDNVICLMQTYAASKNIYLDSVGETIGEILGDEDKFKQMLINLVDNGIKYSEAFDTVTVAKIVDKNFFTIIVEDTGIGISEDAIPRLFERFYRVDKARSRAKGGTGLGLAIVKHIVIGFNGNIKVESTVGVGTKFIITIPYNIE